VFVFGDSQLEKHPSILLVPQLPSN